MIRFNTVQAYVDLERFGRPDLMRGLHCQQSRSAAVDKAPVEGQTNLSNKNTVEAITQRLGLHIHIQTLPSVLGR